VHADEKLTAFLELESAIRSYGVLTSDGGEDARSAGSAVRPDKDDSSRYVV